LVKKPSAVSYQQSAGKTPKAFWLADN
jgi:hypothetical protein